jgi:outer membrane protein assembly factor BamB
MRMFFSAMLVAFVAGAGVAEAGDSPQFRGPDRDGNFSDTGLLKAWPADGPAQVWKAEGLGHGYASASVVGDTIYVPGMLDDGQGYIFALNLDGAVKWQAAYGEETQDRQAPGSRSTPTIDGDRGYVISGLGVVTCFSAANGDILWQVDTVERFGAQEIRWDIAESVAIDGENLICTPGGADASVVALNKMTGDTVWTSRGLSDASAYCSPIVIDHGGRRIVVTMTAQNVVGIDAASGDVLWTHAYPTEHDIHAVSPVYSDGMVYYTSSGGRPAGAMLALSPDGSSVTLKWEDTNLNCFHHGVVLRDGYIYGTSEERRGELMCLELATGQLKWRAEEVTLGSVVAADDMLYVYEGPKAGVVSLVKATPEGFTRFGQFTITEGSARHWAHPTIAGGRLYIRRGDLLFAYNIAAE